LRRLFLLIGAVVLVDTMFLAAVAPLLPEYVEELRLSKTAAGILTASYAAGALIGSLPAGWLTTRLGVRQTLLLGITVVAAASVAFAFGDSAVVLDAARFLQGVGGAWMWAGGMAWLISAYPPERRGQVIGAALGAVVMGLLLGPVIGGLATVAGSEVVFSAVAAIMVVLGAWALALPGVPREEGHTLKATVALLRRPAVLAGIWLLVLPAVFSGVVEVLVPLRLDELGASGIAIGAVFLVAAAVEGVLSPLSGRLSDNRGRLFPIRLGLGGALLMALAAPLPDSILLLGGVLVLVFTALAGLWAPAMAIISDASERAGVAQGYAFAIMNIGWAIGHMVGSAAGGALADASSDYLPYGVLAAVCAATLAGVLALGRRSSHAHVA
jgi:MFS family permease